MSHWIEVLACIIVALGASWAVLIVVLWKASPDAITIRDAVRLVPDLARLVRRLAKDPTMPRRLRIRLWLLLAYLVSPIDLVPDVIPVIGFADDVIIVILVLRSVLRIAGREAIVQHWTGSPENLKIVLGLLTKPTKTDDSLD